jgi:hypothetical protein
MNYRQISFLLQILEKFREHYREAQPDGWTIMQTLFLLPSILQQLKDWDNVPILAPQTK